MEFLNRAATCDGGKIESDSDAGESKPRAHARHKNLSDKGGAKGTHEITYVYRSNAMRAGDHLRRTRWLNSLARRACGGHARDRVGPQPTTKLPRGDVYAATIAGSIYRSKHEPRGSVASCMRRQPATRDRCPRGSSPSDTFADAIARALSPCRSPHSSTPDKHWAGSGSDAWQDSVRLAHSPLPAPARRPLRPSLGAAPRAHPEERPLVQVPPPACLLYTSDAADD